MLGYQALLWPATVQTMHGEGEKLDTFETPYSAGFTSA